AGGRAEPDSARWFELAGLPGHHLRVTFRGAPAGSRGVTIGGRPASLRNGDWTAVVALPRRNGLIHLPAAGRDGSGRPWRRSCTAILRDDPSSAARGIGDGTIAWRIPRDGQFETSPVLFRWTATPGAAPRELAVRSHVLELLPASLRLRKPMRLEWSPAAAEGVGLFGDDGEGWSWIPSPLDSTVGRRVGETRHFARFALFADTIAPRLTLRPAPRRVPKGPPKGPYDRWALEARVVEEGSGVDARSSRYEVDGRRMPTEWDSEEGILRWRPPRRPHAGSHRYQVVVRDRAGNERRASGTFAVK
ncbi:MAG: hypothetical protein ACRENJ_05995, partial [Candidatus Eiseniibacteriota bacterium]